MQNGEEHGGAALDSNLGPAVLPDWLPPGALHYIMHTGRGRSIRAIARDADCHASTILRQIRRFENRRDDPLVDEALDIWGAQFTSDQSRPPKDQQPMSVHIRQLSDQIKPANLEREGRRVLRRLCENGAVLAVAKDLDKAVVVRDLPGGKTARTAVVDREIARAMALKDWITTTGKGATGKITRYKITRYKITTAGRNALKRMLAGAENSKAGFAEAPAVFGAQHREFGEKPVLDEETGNVRPVRYNMSESPLTILARRKDKNGKHFLGDDLVAAGERLREDFELAHMGPRVGQNWERFMTGGGKSGFAPDSGTGSGPAAARERVSKALRDLGSGLGDVVLRCCCYLEGMEKAERRMGWSARSGKIVLRIALQRLKRHYDEQYGPHGPLIG
jgi:hypothetical protein